MLSALGRGSHASVVAGAQHKALRQRTYYPLGYEYLRLNKQNQKVQDMFLIRDAIFNNKFPEAAKVNGIFRLTPQQRREYHYGELMPQIRRRSIFLKRIERQRQINAIALADAEKTMIAAQKRKGAVDDEGEEQEDPRAQLITPDSDVYFLPTRLSQNSAKSKVNKVSPYNTWPNFWQHPSRRDALVPNPKWERHPELGGITRVHEKLSEHNSFY